MRSSPKRADGLIAEIESVNVALGEVASEEGDEAGVGVNQDTAAGHQRGVDEVADKPQSAEGVVSVEDTGEEELNVDHLNIIICYKIIIYYQSV